MTTSGTGVPARDILFPIVITRNEVISGRRGKIYRKLDYFVSFFEISVLNLFSVSDLFES
jgi:hypothetical protein